jgi:hypothetical protein
MGKYVRWSLGTAAHRRHHQEKRAERTFASTSRGGRQPRERERKKNQNRLPCHTCVCIHRHTQSLPRLFGCGLTYLMLTSVESGGIFFSRKWIENVWRYAHGALVGYCVETGHDEAFESSSLLSVSSTLGNYLGIISWDLLVLNDQRWPLLSSHSKMNPHFMSELFPTDNKLLASGEIHSSSSG